jgi:hypothetical protein
MRRLFETAAAYEYVLYSFYSDEMKPLSIIHNDILPIVMERFKDILSAMDVQKGTNHLRIAKIIYSNPEFNSNNSYYKALKISRSTLWRFRTKYVDTLRMVIEHFNTKNE